MTTPRPSIATRVALTLAGGLCAGADAGGGLEYTESSAGLNQPVLEAGPTELEFGDVDGDGFPDLVSVGDHGSPFVNSGEHGVMVWFGSLPGTWTVVQTGTFGYGGVALGDADGDGFMDVGYGIHHDYSSNDLGDQILEVAVGDGTGTSWTPWDDGLATNGETWGMFGTDFADVDNDGDLDVGSISFGCCAGLHVYLNNGDGTWTQSWGFLGGNSSLEFTFGDVNGDGCADFAAGHGTGTVHLGDGEGGFTLADGNLPPASLYRRGIALGDVTGDGRDDLSFVTSLGVAVYTWSGPGQWQDRSGVLATVGSVDFTQIVDMNTDGHGDVVAFSPGRTVVYTGDGGGGWTTAATITTAPSCDSSAFRAGADVDHNGKPDFAFVAEEECRPFVGGINRLHLFRETSVPVAAAIFPVFPRGGETVAGGSVRFIDWFTAVPTGQPTMTIELSVSGAAGPFELVVAGAPDNGRLQWTVPDVTATRPDCVLRLTLDTVPPLAVLTPAPFTIIPGSRIPGDVNGDGVVDVLDLLAVLGAWGPCPPPPASCPADLDGNGTVDVLDLLIVLANWSV